MKPSMPRALCALVIFTSSVASAQVLDPATRLQRYHAGDATTPSEFSFFSSLEVSQLTFDSAFAAAESGSTTMPAAAGASPTVQGWRTSSTYETSGLATTIMTPTVGVGYALSPKLALTLGFGPSFIKVNEQQTKLTSEGGKRAAGSQDIEHDMQPGFAAMLGGSYQFLRWSNVGFSAGARVAYQSAARLAREYVQTETEIVGASDLTRTSELKTNNASLNLFSLSAHVGADWNPFNSYATNHFGVLVGGTYGTATLDKSESDGFNSAGRYTTTTKTLTAALATSAPVGVYYGWTWFVPRLGVLGVEGRFVTSTTAIASYEYVF